MLLTMMMKTQADGPFIGWLEPSPAISPAADVGTFDRELATAGDRAAMAPNPGAMGWASTRGSLARFKTKTRGEVKLRHLQTRAAARRRPAGALSNAVDVVCAAAEAVVEVPRAER